MPGLGNLDWATVATFEEILTPPEQVGNVVTPSGLAAAQEWAKGR